MARLQKRLFTSTVGNTWTVPAGVTRIWVYGTGGGGGGGGGCSGATSTTIEPGGGGGGGAGFSYGQWLDVTPGEVLTVTAGTFGQGGAPSGLLGGISGSPGDNGGPSSISNAGGTIRLFWSGGLGGRGGQNTLPAAGGGRNHQAPDETNIDRGGRVCVVPGYGGVGGFSSGTTYGYSKDGQYSGMCEARQWLGFAATGGTDTASSGSYKGGGGGGGGGYADWPILASGVPGVPGFGGAGGIPNNVGNAIQDGSTGGDASGFGNGGGGGGGGGCASGTPSFGGAGGDGVIGAVMIVWVE